MTKSLGQKLHGAATRRDPSWFIPWDMQTDKERTDFEAIALAFCASLSHDETATATIEALTAERDALAERVMVLEGALKEIRIEYDRPGSKPHHLRRVVAIQCRVGLGFRTLSPSPLVEGGR